MSESEYVHDARNGNVTGPYEPGDGASLARELNAMVARNELGFIATIASEIRGPFYVHPDDRPRYSRATWQRTGKRRMVPSPR